MVYFSTASEALIFLLYYCILLNYVLYSEETKDLSFKEADAEGRRAEDFTSTVMHMSDQGRAAEVMYNCTIMCSVMFR